MTRDTHTIWLFYFYIYTLETLTLIHWETCARILLAALHYSSNGNNTTQISTNRRTGSYRNNMDEPPGHYVKQRQPDRKEYIQCDFKEF